MLQRIWTISNLLSLSRIVLLAPFALLLSSDSPDRYVGLGLVIGIGILTDFLDGFLARKLHQVTDLGKILDPLADKISVGGAAILFVVAGMLPLWYVLVVILRDLVILAGAVYIKTKKNVVTQSNWPGKIAVSLVAIVLLFSIIPGEFVAHLRTVAIWLSIAVMAVSLAVYAQRLFIGLRTHKRGGI